jgi:hypothetical protein
VVHTHYVQKFATAHGLTVSLKLRYPCLEAHYPFKLPSGEVVRLVTLPEMIKIVR